MTLFRGKEDVSLLGQWDWLADEIRWSGFDNTTLVEWWKRPGQDPCLRIDGDLSSVQNAVEFGRRLGHFPDALPDSKDGSFRAVL
jgi:hypothetical protein